MTASLAIGAAVIFTLMTLVWLLSLRMKDASIADVFWGLGFLATAVTYFLTSDREFTVIQVLLLGLLAVWGTRLAIHLYLRNRAHGEDFRYRRWREQAGSSWWWRSYFKVFLLQGALMWVIALPLVPVLVGGPQRPNWQPVIAGVLLWSIGFAIEAVADWQLRRFQSAPRNAGKVLTHGLWRYSRHPNYFGEALLWWGYYLIAVAVGGGWTVISPLLMTFLLVRVSGVAMLERSLQRSKPGYQQYIQSTSAFLPWIPGRDKEG